MTTADSIKNLRISHNLTQTEFGEIAGVSCKAVSTWEQGIKLPRMGAVQRLSDHFHIPKSQVLFGMTETNSVSPARQALLDIVSTCSDAEAERLLTIVEAVLGKTP